MLLELFHWGGRTPTHGRRNVPWHPKFTLCELEMVPCGPHVLKEWVAHIGPVGASGINGS